MALSLPHGRGCHMHCDRVLTQADHLAGPHLLCPPLGEVVWSLDTAVPRDRSSSPRRSPLAPRRHVPLSPWMWPLPSRHTFLGVAWPKQAAPRDSFWLPGGSMNHSYPLNWPSQAKDMAVKGQWRHSGALPGPVQGRQLGMGLLRPHNVGAVGLPPEDPGAALPNC